MTTIGDVLMVFGGMAAFAFTLWALLLLAATLFGRHASAAASELSAHSGRMVALGTVAGVPALVVAWVLIAVPSPVTKVFGFILAGLILLVGVVGAAGLAQLAGQRIEQTDGARKGYAATGKGAFLVVVACMMPILGWLFIAPVTLLACLGSGLRALGTKQAASTLEGNGAPL